MHCPFRHPLERREHSLAVLRAEDEEHTGDDAVLAILGLDADDLAPLRVLRDRSTETNASRECTVLDVKAPCLDQRDIAHDVILLEDAFYDTDDCILTLRSRDRSDDRHNLAAPGLCDPHRMNLALRSEQVFGGARAMLEDFIKCHVWH